MHSHYTLGFNQEEKQELLNIFENHPKWKERINNSYSFSVNIPNTTGYKYRNKKTGEIIISSYIDSSYWN